MKDHFRFKAKAWVAASSGAFIALIVSALRDGFGFDVPWLETVVTWVVLWFVTWLVPNAQPPAVAGTGAGVGAGGPTLRSFAVLALLAVVLAGCANLFAPPNALSDAERARLTTQGRVFEIRAQFNAAQRAFQSYAAQPFCTEIRVVACADAAVVIRAQALTAEALGALEAAETAAQAGAGDAPAIAAAARVALARLSQFIITREELPP